MARNEDQYEIFNSDSVHEHFGTFRYEPGSLLNLVKALGLTGHDEAKLHQRLKLVAGFYLAPERQRMVGTDRFTSLGLLNKIARMADDFAELLDRLPPNLAAVLHLTPTDEPLADRPDAPMPHQLSRLVSSLGTAAAYHAVGAAPTGRRGRGIELDPVYGDVILKRLREVTGCEPMLDGVTPFSEVQKARSTASSDDAS